MGRRSDVDRLCNLVDRAPNQQLLKRVAADDLRWNLDKLERVISQAQAKGRPLHRVRGGHSIRYRGGERRGGANGVGLYNDIASGIVNYWGRDHQLRDCRMGDTSRVPLHEKGVWVRPDLVVYAHPRRRATRDAPRLAHAIEIERGGGFDIRSVYQAHAQGRRADFSWVFFQPDTKLNEAWDRICLTAKELGVGLVRFANSQAVRTWQQELPAGRRTPSDKERETFRSDFPELPDARAAG